MSLRLNRSEPIFRTIIELPGIGRRPRTRDDIRQSRNLPNSYMIVRDGLKIVRDDSTTMRWVKKQQDLQLGTLILVPNF